jgi:hypothetical protein
LTIFVFFAKKLAFKTLNDTLNDISRHPPAQTGTDRHRHLPAQTGPDRTGPALTGLDRHMTGTDRPGLFYDVFDKNFLNILPSRAIQYKMSTKNVIKQPGPVGAGLVPVQSVQGRSVPVGTGLGRSVPVRCRLVPVPVPVPVDPAADWCRPVPTGAVKCRPVPMPLTDRKKRCRCFFYKMYAVYALYA